MIKFIAISTLTLGVPKNWTKKQPRFFSIESWHMKG